MIFSKGGQSAGLGIAVPAAGTVKLLNVRIAGNTVAAPAANPGIQASATSAPVSRDDEDDDEREVEEDESEDEARETDD